VFKGAIKFPFGELPNALLCPWIKYIHASLLSVEVPAVFDNVRLCCIIFSESCLAHLKLAKSGNSERNCERVIFIAVTRRKYAVTPSLCQPLPLANGQPHRIKIRRYSH
jgi:hypothetical protein